MPTNGHDKPVRPIGYSHDTPAGAAKGNGKAVKFVLDGVEVEAQPGETLWQVASRLGTEIPHLCYAPEPGYRADARHEGEDRVGARQGLAQDGVRAPARRPAGPRHRGARSAVEVLGVDRPHGDRREIG